MADFILKEPLVFTDGTGFDINPNTEIFAKTSGIEVVFSIGQDVSTSSNVEFADLTLTDKLTLDNDTFIIRKNIITGSFTHTGNLITSIDEAFVHNGNMTVGNILTAEKILSEITQSATFFESGSTLFGNSLDDIHSRTGSLSISGSSMAINYGSVTEISNDTTLADEGTTSVLTENAFKTYFSDQTTNFQRYQRKSFAHTGSFISVSTASFAAVTASAPSGFTSTSENDFMFFINGQIMEHDAITIEQSGSEFLVQVDNDGIGYDLKSSDEIVAFGKFDNTYYLDFDGANDEVTTNFSGSGVRPLNKTYSFWYKSTTTGKNRSVFGYGGEKKGAFTPNFNAGRPLMWNGNNWYVYWDDTSAQDDGEWHHWMVFNDVESIVDSKLYVDGTLIDINQTRTTGTISNLQNQTQPLTIGSFRNNSTNAGYHFEGSIREFAVFSGDKTSNASIFYNGGIPYDLSDEADLQGYWQMNEGSGTTVADLSGEGNDGTIDGATWDYLV
jgi:hypothetical protein